jgi:hypothetical protein
MATEDQAADAKVRSTAPNQYHLHGHHIAVSYYPDGLPPSVITPDGPTFLSYHDAHRSRAFGRDELDLVAVPGLGTVVTITLSADIDLGSTTFSLVLPRVGLADASSASIHVDAITTLHKGHVRLVGQDETYTVTQLVGTASSGPLPQ